MVTPLSRRDRAALVLAYELIRTRWALDAEDELRAVVDVLQAATTFTHEGDLHTLARAFEAERRIAYLMGDRPNRLLRARLALLLRAILRADAARPGPRGAVRGEAGAEVSPYRIAAAPAPCRHAWVERFHMPSRCTFWDCSRCGERAGFWLSVWLDAEADTLWLLRGMR